MERTAPASRLAPPAKRSVFQRLGGADPPRPKRLTPHGEGDQDGSPPRPPRRGCGTAVRHMSAFDVLPRSIFELHTFMQMHCSVHRAL